jgi:hypothetical protein
MSERQAELKARADAYRKEALKALEAAEKAATDEHRTEFLLITEQWLRLSSELQELAALIAE